MLFNIYSLTCLFLTNFLIQSTTCAVPTNIQNLELDDVTSLWDKFPSIIDQIKETVSRFRCPKGWKRLGGSCYYLSNLTSTSIDANYTCNYLHSNLSNLMQIRNTVELFYAVHVLSRNNLPSLMIDIHPNLLKGRKISEMLMNDEDRWGRMKGKFHEVRVKYQRLKEKIVDQLSSSGLRILQRSKKIKQIPRKQHITNDEIDPNQYDQYDFDDRELNLTKLTFQNDTIINMSSIIDNDEYEYEDLDSPDEIDEFEQIEDIRGICDRIYWNVDNNNSTVYILTTYIVLDKIACSFSDVEINTEYPHVCEYVLDFCFANIVCGKHGHCDNTLAGFKCSCSFLYGGLLCEKLSENGQQIIISIIIIIILIALSLSPIRWLLWKFMKLLIYCSKKLCNMRKQKKEGTNDDRQQLVERDRLDNNGEITVSAQSKQPGLTAAQEFIELIRDICRCITVPKTSNPIKRNLARTIWVAMLNLFFLSLLYISTSFIYLMSFGYFINDDKEEEFSINDTIRLVTQCERISDYRRGNIIFAPFALVLILIFSWSIKREKQCLDMCDGRPALIPPIEPFRTANRFTTATVFGILAFEVLKIFEGLLFNTGQPFQQGVLIELLERIALVILVGLRYYPVLASLQLRNIVARFFTCLYIVCDMIYTIVREGSCMGFLPLSGHYTALEEAKLRKELGTWFIIYGLIKNIPHFCLLSYISAEIFVRFIYDSIYVPLKKKKTIWSSPVVQLDESEFAKYYVTKLFRRNRRSILRPVQQNTKTNPDNLIDYEYEAELQKKLNQSRIQKLFNFIYHWDDDFHFTTIATCTYTVAIVFLYYLACTFVFLYLSRTTGHILFLKFYIESTFNVDLGAFSLKFEIILSAIFTVILYGFQLFLGMQYYKKHKLQLYKGIYVDVPPAVNFKPSSLASNSVHYSGFLVGYLAWGFVICFHLILLILIALRIVSLQIRHVELVLAIVVPVLVIYFLKMLSMRSAGKFLFIQKLDDKLNLKSRKTYAIFVYFSFFADCFLGIASCIIRLIKATCLNVIYMARLDCSFLGRPLEKFDLGFAAYISYLHMEVAYTNPVMLAFCYSLFDDIVQQRPKQCYDDECCIAPGELDDDETIETARQNESQQKRRNLASVRYRRRKIDNASTLDNNMINANERSSEKTKEDLSTIEITSETELLNLSIISTKEIQKQIGRKTKQQSNITDEGEQSNTPTYVRLRHEHQQSFGFVPEVPPREDLSSQEDKYKNETETDDDGGLQPESFPIIAKIMPQQQSSKRNLDNREDGGVSKQNKTQQKTNQNNDVPKRQESNKKKTPNKPKKDLPKDEDDECIGQPSDTAQMIIPSKQPILYNLIAKQDSSSDNTDNDSKPLSKHKKRSTTSTSYDTIGRIVPKISDTNRNIKSKQTTSKYHYDTVPKDEEHEPQATTSYHRVAHQSTRPLIPYRANISPILHRHKNTNDDDSSIYSEITNDTTQSAVSNPSYSIIGLIQTSSDHSNKQQHKRNEDTDVESEEEEEQEEVELLKSQSNESTSDTAIKAEEEKELERIRQRKRLRFRWHFLYTILRNYHLFDLRKDVQGRLTRLHLQKSNLIDEQQLLTTITMQQPPSVTFVPESITATAEGRLVTPDIPRTIEPRPPPTQRLLSVPVSVFNEYPTSPAERYIAIRAHMLYDSNTQQTDASYTAASSQTPTTATLSNQQFQRPITTASSDQSLGFPISPDIIVQPPSESSTRSTQNQTNVYLTPRGLQRETLTPSLFQPASASNQSTADYPLAASSTANSSTFRTQMSHEQHMQAWRQEQMGKIQKTQRHCYIYGTPPQPLLVDKVSTAAILTPQILPTATQQQQVPPTPNTGKTPRRPTASIFSFPLPSSQIRSAASSIISDTNNQKLKTKLQQQNVPIPPQRMDRLDEDPQEISNTNKPSKTTLVLIHKDDSQSDTSDVT